MRHLLHRMHRRGFPGAVSLGFIVLTYSSLAQATDGAAAKPNLLLIICDDLNDWALHPPGHPRVRTPHMDRLREKSMSFSNAHVVVPVCGPSRKCLFSGLYPQTIKDYGFAAWKNTEGLQGCVPLPLHFRNNGYNTYGTGKLLHEGAGGEFYTAYGIGPDYGPWPWQGKGGPMNTPHPDQFGTWEAHLPLAMHRDLNYGPLSNVPDWKADAVKGIPGAKGWYNESGKRFRYILCGNGEEELYDHERDPNEWTNLASDPEHAETRKKLREEMTAILRRTEIPAGFPIQAGNP